jgi:DNA-binding NarL/FixJ family response regulator
MAVLALISDLMMQSQVAGAATRAAAVLEIATTADALLARAAAGQPTLVIVDLSHPGIDPRELLGSLKRVLPVESVTLAFGPHVHAARLAEATEAGCDTVISRGQFHAQMDAILKRYAE